MTSDADLTTVVIPTVGRPSLRVLLDALASGTAPVPGPVLLVDDRPASEAPHPPLPGAELPGVRVLRSGGRGPAAARNLGWRHARTPWVSFLDDDVVPHPDWSARLVADLTSVDEGTAASQGRVHVPLPTDRRPTDWERGTAGLADALWITADLSYRRRALVTVGGFDERFPRAFREDADLGLRVTRHSGPIARGSREIDHPVRPADDWASLRQQRGNEDDFLMRAVHGRDWRDRASAPAGRRPRHVATTLAGVVGAAGLLAGRTRIAALGTLGWAAGTAEFAWRRIAPGPRDRDEVRRMLLTSAAIPPAATWHSLRGAVRHRRAAPWRGLPDLVLLDRDGTLVHDVPYNGDPEQVAPLPGVREALDRLRREGIRLGMVTNQSGIGSGRITHDQARAVNARVEELLGPFDTVHLCPHARDGGCACRKPEPGLIKQACADLDVPPDRCVMIGDIDSDVAAADAAGVRGLLVPTPQTRAEEVADARAAGRLVPSLGAAVDRILEGTW